MHTSSIITSLIYLLLLFHILGYANEIGEALRGHIGGTWVSYTYMIAAAYILGDTFSKARRVYEVIIKLLMTMQK